MVLTLPSVFKIPFLLFFKSPEEQLGSCVSERIHHDAGAVQVRLDVRRYKPLSHCSADKPSSSVTSLRCWTPRFANFFMHAASLSTRSVRKRGSMARRDALGTKSHGPVQDTSSSLFSTSKPHSRSSRLFFVQEQATVLPSLASHVALVKPHEFTWCFSTVVK
jgi:hypothetical protein